MSEPPSCPYCGKPLEKVYVTIYETWFYEDGRYHQDTYLDEEEIFCPHCSGELSEVFPDGVCNFEGEEKDE